MGLIWSVTKRAKAPNVLLPSQNASPSLNTVSTKLCTWKQQSQALGAGASSLQRKPNHLHEIRAVLFPGQWGLTLATLQSLKHFPLVPWYLIGNLPMGQQDGFSWLRFVILHAFLIAVPGQPGLWSGSYWPATKRKCHRKGRGGANLQRICICHQH